MPIRKSGRPESEDGWTVRAGAAALGMFAGIAIGLLLAWLSYAVLARSPSFPSLLFGGAAAGVIVGLLLPEETMSLFEIVTHFFFGLLAAGTDSDLEDAVLDPPAHVPRLLRLAALFGAVLAAAVWLFGKWN